MDLRFATAEDIPSLLALVQRVVPQMRADGNLQWDANLGYRFAGEISLKIRPGCGSFVTRSDLPSVRTLQKDLIPQTFCFPLRVQQDVGEAAQSPGRPAPLCIAA